VDPIVIALVAGGMGVMWWRHLRRAGTAATRALGTVFDGDAEVVLHVAAHEARSRGTPLSSVHVLYGLLQDETITSALRECGRDPEALEDRVLTALGDPSRSPLTDEDAHRVYGYAAGHASHANRRATPRDLWAYLRGSNAATLVEPADLATVLFRLCHGGEPPANAEGIADVHVVLRNDDYTTQAFVTHILEDVFGLSTEQANVRMMQTHTEGRSVIGRFKPDDARAKIESVRTRAKASGFPLWIGFEPI
jgi:ATP-dependent Clp protease adapter protein ClpS